MIRYLYFRLIFCF